MTLSSAMYYTGVDPLSGEEFFVPRRRLSAAVSTMSFLPADDLMDPEKNELLLQPCVIHEACVVLAPCGHVLAQRMCAA
jgi:hypothetical protein